MCSRWWRNLNWPHVCLRRRIFLNTYKRLKLKYLACTLIGECCLADGFCSAEGKSRLLRSDGGVKKVVITVSDFVFIRLFICLFCCRGVVFTVSSAHWLHDRILFPFAGEDEICQLLIDPFLCTFRYGTIVMMMAVVVVVVMVMPTPIIILPFYKEFRSVTFRTCNCNVFCMRFKTFSWKPNKHHGLHLHSKERNWL